MEARAAHLEALLAYRQVREVLEWETGVRIHTRQLREIAARVGADATTFAQTRTVPPLAQAPAPVEVDRVDDPAQGFDGGLGDGPVLVVTFDGKGVVMRREALRSSEPPAPGTSGLPGHEQSGYRRGRMRLAELSCVYDVQPQPRTVADVLAALTGRFADPQPGPPRATTARPRARAHWLQASLTSTIDQVVADTFAQADRRDPTHRCAWLALVDSQQIPDRRHHQARRRPGRSRPDPDRPALRHEA